MSVRTKVAQHGHWGVTRRLSVRLMNSTAYNFAAFFGSRLREAQPFFNLRLSRMNLRLGPLPTLALAKLAIAPHESRTIVPGRL